MLYVLSTLSYDTSLLSHFLKYYRDLGVRSFIISVHELVPGILQEAQEIAAGIDCSVQWVSVSDRQLATGIEANNKEEIRSACVTPEDWIIPADLDEFIQFPAPLDQLIGEMQRMDATFMKGTFIDRVSADGRLTETRREPSIWKQYPVVCHFSRLLIRCWCHKVTLCRGDCVLSSGHHNVIRPARPLVHRTSAVHHFKWRRGLLQALRRRVATYKKAGWGCHPEAERAVAYLTRNRRIHAVEFDSAIGWDPDRDGLPVSCVILTSITNQLDDLKPLPDHFKANAEAVAFLDQPQDAGSWRIMPAWDGSTDPCRNAKRPKIVPHLYFPEAQYSLWIDGSVRILSQLSIHDLIAKYLADTDIAVFKHKDRDCAYNEAEVCIHKNKDDHRVIQRQMARYRYESFPRKRGLAECCIILRRHTPRTRLFNEVWWEEICAHSRRDQLSFNYVAWKLGVKYSCFDGTVRDNELFKIQKHRGCDRPSRRRQATIEVAAHSLESCAVSTAPPAVADTAPQRPRILYATIYPPRPDGRSETFITRQILKEYSTMKAEFDLSVIIASAHQGSLDRVGAVLADFPAIRSQVIHFDTEYAGMRAEEISHCKERLAAHLAGEAFDYLLFMDADIWTPLRQIPGWIREIGNERESRYVKIKCSLRDRPAAPARALGAYFHHKALLTRLRYWRAMFPKESNGRRRGAPDQNLESFLTRQRCSKVVPENLVTYHFSGPDQAHIYDSGRLFQMTDARALMQSILEQCPDSHPAPLG